jgi:hypothetical protein
VLLQVRRGLLWVPREPHGKQVSHIFVRTQGELVVDLQEAARGGELRSPRPRHNGSCL